MWLATRAWLVWMLFGPFLWVQGDLLYFDQSLARAGHHGWGHVLVEYPLPGVVVLAVPWLVAHLAGHASWYFQAFVTMMLLVDASYVVLLRRRAGTWTSPPVLVWLVALPLFGPTAYARFDLVPGVLLGVSVLLLVTRPRVAALAAGLATGVKLWPALVLPALAARTRERRAVVTTVALVGALLVSAGIALSGWSRLLSPLLWQQHRGLQIESVPATPSMLAWSLARHGLAVAPSRFNALEVSGPGVSTALTVVSLAGVVLLLAVAALSWRAWRTGPHLEVETVAWVCLAAVSGFVVTSKVFSPQYLLWLLPVATAALASGRARRGPLLRWTILLVLVCALTQMVFPLLYPSLIDHDQASFRSAVLLAVRNALTVLLTLLAWREAWRRTRPRPRARRAMHLRRVGQGW